MVQFLYLLFYNLVPKNSVISVLNCNFCNWLNFCPSTSIFQVFANLYAAHMDPNVWDKPHEFRPERFLDDEGNVINKDLMIAFSLGKIDHEDDRILLKLILNIVYTNFLTSIIYPATRKNFVLTIA